MRLVRDPMPRHQRKMVLLGARLVWEVAPKRWTGAEPRNCWALFFESQMFAALDGFDYPKVKAWREDWNARSIPAVRGRQGDDGSWPADGIWGPHGGRVQSTAVHVLVLLAPYRDDPAVFGRGAEPMRDALLAFLRKSANSSDRQRAARAQDLWKLPLAN